MKILKNSKSNAVFIVSISSIYAFIFIFISNHIEFQRLLKHPKTLSGFWNKWSSYVANGNLKYIGYATIFLAIIVLVLTIFRKQTYDEYQINILSKFLMVSGLITILVLPLVLILILSDPNYAIETVLLFLTIQWLWVLAIDLIYLIKYCL